MVNANQLSVDFYNEMVDVIGIDPNETQLIASQTLYNIKPNMLKFPRLIYGIEAYDDSDYYFQNDEYNEDKDVFNMDTILYPNITYKFTIYSDDDSADKIYDTILEIYNYYANVRIDKTEKCNTKMVVTNTSPIRDVYLKIDSSDSITTAYTFSIDFTIEDILKSEIGYATSIETELIVRDD